MFKTPLLKFKRIILKSFHSNDLLKKSLFPPYVKAIFIVISLAICPNVSFAKDSKGKMVTDTIQVKGNCSMCKKNIESALEVKGIHEAEWDAKTHLLIVTYWPSKITLEQIEQKVAQSGYDTEHVKADDNVYHKLHSCCQYER